MTAANPTVSVVVGVLNGGRTLERCIDSVAAQSLTTKELIIKDGGSTDATLEIIERRKRDITLFESGRDRSLYDAWNVAIERCRGDYVCFLGCDDQFAHPYALERLVAQSPSSDPPELICSLNAVVDSSGNYLRTLGQPWSWEGMRRANVVAHPGLLHRRDLFSRYGNFGTDYKIAGDYEFLLRLGPTTKSLFVDQVTVRMAAGGMSHRRWRTTLREVWRAQAGHPDIGVAVATKNYGANLARFAWKKLRAR